MFWVLLILILIPIAYWGFIKGVLFWVVIASIYFIIAVIYEKNEGKAKEKEKEAEAEAKKIAQKRAEELLKKQAYELAHKYGFIINCPYCLGNGECMVITDMRWRRSGEASEHIYIYEKPDDWSLNINEGDGEKWTSRSELRECPGCKGEGIAHAYFDDSKIECSACKGNGKTITHTRIKKEIGSTKVVEELLCAVCQGKGFKTSEIVHVMTLHKPLLGYYRDCKGCEREALYDEEMQKHWKFDIIITEQNSDFYSKRELRKFEIANNNSAKAIEANSKDSDISTDLESTNYKKENFDTVIEVGQTVNNIDPKISLKYRRLGSEYEKKGDYDLAIETYKNAISLDPKNVYGYSSLGKAYQAKDDIDMAIKYFQKSVEIDQKYAYGYSCLSKAYEKIGDHNKADLYHKKATQFTSADA